MHLDVNKACCSYPMTERMANIGVAKVRHGAREFGKEAMYCSARVVGAVIGPDVLFVFCKLDVASRSRETVGKV